MMVEEVSLERVVGKDWRTSDSTAPEGQKASEGSFVAKVAMVAIQIRVFFLLFFFFFFVGSQAVDGLVKIKKNKIKNKKGAMDSHQRVQNWQGGSRLFLLWG